MRKIIKKVLSGALFIASGSLSFASPSTAPITACANDSSTNCTFGTLYENIGIASYSGIQIIYLVSILIGVAGVIFGLLKLRQHGMDGQGSSGALRQAIYSLVISSLLISVPVIALLVNGTFLGQSNIPMVPENTVANYGQSGVN
jgi:uncharacterized membrane protein HdeD (DUF308 family)